MKPWTVADIRALGVTTDLVTAGEILGIGRSKSYELARRDEFPVRMLRIAGRYRILTADLITFLRIDDNTDPAA
jgi:hypothetical protein